MAFEASEPAFFRQLHVGRWYGVSMVGVAELGIREYVRRKEPEEKKHEQLELNLPQAPSRGVLPPSTVATPPLSRSNQTA